MSLREQLKRAVASCAPIETQLATFPASDATARATPAQPQGRQSATDAATPAQLPQKSTATHTAPGCAAVASELTAHRTMKKLLAAAMRACDHRRDGPEAREQMKKEVMETPPHLRADLLDHFRQNYPD